MIETGISAGQEAETVVRRFEPMAWLRSVPEARLIAWLRLGFWPVAFFLGAVQTWVTRHGIFSDGISYIEIAKRYLAGDWTNALNSYWSPLYSWLLAAAYYVIRPEPYWEVGVLHVVNFIGYLLSIGAFEFFLRELLRYRAANNRNRTFLPASVMYLAGYCAILIAGLATATIWYCSPDMYAMALLLLLSGLLLRVGVTGGSTSVFVLIGLVSGLSFLARTAFVPTFAVCLAVCALLLLRKRQPVLRPLLLATAVMLAISAPFVIAISLKTGRFTIGDSGALNYGWEIDGAARYAHWQGEPGDLGQPKHPTTLLSSSPNAYAFAAPVPGTYPPWFNPSYWYDGIKPRFKWKPQLEVFLVNVSVLANLFARSVVFLCLAGLLLLGALRGWFRNFVHLWPVLLPSFTVLALYCLVYVEKRYIAGNLVVIWLSALAAVELGAGFRKIWAPRAVAIICLGYTAIFVLRRQIYPVRETLRDLVARQEYYKNSQFLLAQQLLHAGLRPGDRIAYIGPAVDADWARLAGVKIVAEIPLIYARFHKPLNNTLNDLAVDIRGFWLTDPAHRQAIIEGFRKAGARMIVTDGFYERKYVRNWAKALPTGLAGVPTKMDPDIPNDLDTRYAWLDPTVSTSQVATLVR